jgi:hypothetical protein
MSAQYVSRLDDRKGAVTVLSTASILMSARSRAFLRNSPALPLNGR